MKKLFLLAFVVLFPLTAFAQSKTTKVQHTQARMLDVNANSYVKPLTVEVQVNEKIGKVTDVFKLSREKVETELKGNIDNVYSYAIFLATKKYNADLIVAAIFNFQTAENGDGYEVELTGFPANFVNWKTATPDDYEWIRLETTKTTDKATTDAIIKKNN